MKNIINKLIVLLFITLSFSQIGSSQSSFTEEVSYEMNKTYPYISITEQKLKEIQTLTDLNSRYKPSWVREYISVEILANHEGQIRKVQNKSDTLNQQQKDLLTMADAGTDISVKVQYIPENTLKNNDPKEITFTVAVDPENEATYIGGAEQLKEYLKEKAIDKIPGGSFKDYDLAAVQFTVSEEGEITDVHLFDVSIYNSSIDENVNELLLETIQNMPCWKPAEYANGLKVKQEFVLTVGNMESCVVNLLNIRSLPRE
ncbi:MAG: hypothetical protein ACI9VN_000025 [Patescibacteria group bacterium]|jgi:hypothetical protein